MANVLRVDSFAIKVTKKFKRNKSDDKETRVLYLDAFISEDNELSVIGHKAIIFQDGDTKGLFNKIMNANGLTTITAENPKPLAKIKSELINDVDAYPERTSESVRFEGYFATGMLDGLYKNTAGNVQDCIDNIVCIGRPAKFSEDGKIVLESRVGTNPDKVAQRYAKSLKWTKAEKDSGLSDEERASFDNDEDKD